MKKFSYLVELEARSGNPLVKAQIAYKLFENFQIIFGQQSNPFKFYAPSPHEKLTVNYPITKFVPKEQKDDLGITFKGKISLLEYNLSILNGPGANIRDNNSDKDTVIWAKITPWKWIFLNVCWQGGWQNNPERYYRSGQWVQAQFQFYGFTIKPTWVKRNDMQDEGWFILALHQLNSEDKLLLQYLKDKEKKELTIGAIIRTKKVSIQILPNLVLQRRVNGEYNIEAYLMLQIDLNRPKSNKREENLEHRN